MFVRVAKGPTTSIMSISWSLRCREPRYAEHHAHQLAVVGKHEGQRRASSAAACHSAVRCIPKRRTSWTSAGRCAGGCPAVASIRHQLAVVLASAPAKSESCAVQLASGGHCPLLGPAKCEHHERQLVLHCPVPGQRQHHEHELVSPGHGKHREHQLTIVLLTDRRPLGRPVLPV